MKSKILCPLPFMHQYISSTGGVTPCCHVFDEPDPWPRLDFTKGIYTQAHKDVRRQLMSEIWPSVCSKCKIVEQNGGKSPRQMALERFGFPKTKHLTYLDISFTNTCNLACRMCKPSDSSLLEELYKDKEKLPTWIEPEWAPRESQVPDKKVAYVKKVIADGLQVLKVTGGEPFACKYFMSVVDWAIENDHAKNLEINLTTNGTKINKVLIHKLLKFKKAKLLVSIDGTGKVYEYIRHNASWDKVYNNLKQLSEHPEIDVQVACLMMFHNTTNVINLIYDCAKLNISVFVDEYIKPQNSEITPYHVDEKISKILIEQSEKIKEDFGGEEKSQVQYHALQGAKTLYNIATNTSVRGKARQRLLRTINLQDKLYKTNYQYYLQPEQIEYLERIANV